MAAPIPIRSPVAAWTTAIRVIAPPTTPQTKAPQIAARTAWKNRQAPPSSSNAARNGAVRTKAGWPTVQALASRAAPGSGREVKGAGSSAAKESDEVKPPSPIIAAERIDANGTDPTTVRFSEVRA